MSQRVLITAGAGGSGRMEPLDDAAVDIRSVASAQWRTI